MNSKQSPRTRKHKQPQTAQDMKQEIVVQVHKTIKSSTTSSENDYVNSDENFETNKAYKEDKNDNNIHNTPSRDISVDSESQINSKILSLIETEIKKDVNKHSHFTDSRPQSLSFYEDEKMPEELSGNLELLSPEERKHYKKRKEYIQMDTDEMNAYNVIHDLYNRDGDEIMTSSITKKSKSRKKRHGESEPGIGDSREMMIPKEKRKSKKKKRDFSPISAANAIKKSKHKRRDDEYETRNDIAVALEELQDDVFESGQQEELSVPRQEKIRKSPRKSDKMYVQKKNKFESVPRNGGYLSRQGAFEGGNPLKKPSTYFPLDIAICYHTFWMRISTLCHGLLSGLALGHWLYLICNKDNQDNSFLQHYAYYSDIYVGLFFTLCVLCIVSVYDRIDIAHMESIDIKDIFETKKFSLVIIVYIACLLVHLSATSYDDKLSLITYNNETIYNITQNDVRTWNHLSLWRTILSFTAWLFVGLGPPEDMLYTHLKNMEKYLPQK